MYKCNQLQVYNMRNTLIRPCIQSSIRKTRHISAKVASVLLTTIKTCCKMHGVSNGLSRN